MNFDEVRLVVQAVEGRGVQRPLLLPGSIGQVDGSGLVEVVMDSDPEGTSIEASCLFADVGEGDRVMVMFDPPRGVYVVGLIGRVIEAGQLMTVLSGSVDAEAYTAPSTQVLDVDTEQVSFRSGRFYRVSVELEIELDTLDTDPVNVTATVNLGSPPLSFGTQTPTGVWGTLNGSFVGGANGTLHYERLFSLTSAYRMALGFSVVVAAVTGPGDVDLVYEVAVYDAGPVSAVV